MAASRELPTASATLGPFFPPRYVDAGSNDLSRLAGRAAQGRVIEITGRVIQADGKPLENVVLEFWQADAAGIYAHPADPRHAQADPDFFGWGRAATDRDGAWSLRTILPGGYAMADGPAPNALQSRRAPHVDVQIFYSGLMRALVTAIWFEGEAGNDADPVLAAVPAARRALLVARRESEGRYRFDIRLRGAGETPFFDDA